MRKEVTLSITRVIEGMDELDYEDNLESIISDLSNGGWDVLLEDEENLEDPLTEFYDEYDEYGELDFDDPDFEYDEYDEES